MDNFKYEEWKDIPEFEGYQVSNLGRVKSLKRFRKGKNDCLVSVKEKILKLQINNRGYYQVVLYKNSIGKNYLVHRLVWEAFNGQIPENMQVNHINEIKADNRLENLNLMTSKENTNWGTGNERRGKKLSKSVLQFDLNDNLVKEYPSIQQIYRENGFKQNCICDCCNGKRITAYNFKWKYKN